MRKTSLIAILGGSLILFLSFTGAAVASGPEIAAVQVSPSGIAWSPVVAHDGMALSVSLPDHRVIHLEFKPTESPSFSVVDDKGARRADGLYVWELVATPVIDEETTRRMTAARANDDEEVAWQLIKEGLVPADPMVQSGAFTIRGGSIVDPSFVEEGSNLRYDGSGLESGATSSGTARQSVSTPGSQFELLDQVILDDLIVDGSACIGLDCVNGEAFGFDTIRIKENNLRIRAQDTSNSASFPSRDWQVTFNDSANGGANKFSVDDIDGGRTPFTLEAGAPSHSLYVDDGGRVGNGTSTPVVAYHAKEGNTPTVRLEQDGSSGFTPQTWDVAGNEANFFIRDATNGSTLPFRIFPGAPTDSIRIEADGEVTMGGDLTLDGVVSQGSSREVKEGFRSLDPAVILERLAGVPILEWSYARDVDLTRHVGPMAEDFYAAFGLGRDAQHLTPADAAGIALSAIQELACRNQELSDQKASLEGRVVQLESEIRLIREALGIPAD